MTTKFLHVFLTQVTFFTYQRTLFSKYRCYSLAFFLIYASMHVLPYYRQISQGRKFDRRGARLIRHSALRNFVPI